MKLTKARLANLIKEELSKSQQKLDLDDDGNIEGSDLKGLRSGKKDKDVGTDKQNENIAKIVKEEYSKSLAEGSTDDEWEMVDAVVVALGHEGTLEALVQALPSDSVRDAMEYIARMHEIPMELDEGRTRLEEGNATSKLITRLEVALNTVEGAMGYIENEAALERLQKAVDIGQEVWDGMHDLLPNVNEETKPHEADRKPADTPEDRIRK